VFEVRIHGRGGQGVVTAAELLSLAAFREGRHAQAFPSFGSERTGAPVVSFCRISEREIRTREPIASPHAVVVQDATLLHQVDLFGGLRPEGYLLINSVHSIVQLGLEEWARGFRPERLMTVPAGEICRRHLGQMRPNAAMLGALAALTGVVSLEAVAHAIDARFSAELAERNFAAARECHEHVEGQLREPVGA